MSSEILMTPAMVADKFEPKVSARWIRKLCEEGKIPHRKFGSRYFLIWQEVIDSGKFIPRSLTTEKNIAGSSKSSGKDLLLWQ